MLQLIKLELKKGRLTSYLWGRSSPTCALPDPWRSFILLTP